MTKNRQLLLLGALVIVLGGLLYSNPFGQQTVPPAPPSKATTVETPTTRPAARGARPATAAAATTGVTDVKLELLTSDAGEFTSPQRDPFHFKPKPAPVVAAPPPRPVTTAPATPPPPPVVQRTDKAEQVLKYVGFITAESGVRIATIVYAPGNSPATTLAEVEGSSIEGRFRILRIEPDAVEVTELGGDGQRSRIPRSK